MIELVGPPGAGKTIITQKFLAAGGDEFYKARIRRWRHAPLVAKNACLMLAPFALQYRRITQRRWNKYHIMVQLGSLQDITGLKRATNPEIIVLDQGPVYLLSILQRALRASRRENSRRFQNFWETTLATWADRLDVVVKLDAGDDILYRRILQRGTPHPVARLTRAQASRFFANSRASRDRILALLQSVPGGPWVYHLNTGDLSLDQTVGQIRSLLAPKPCGALSASQPRPSAG